MQRAVTRAELAGATIHPAPAQPRRPWSVPLPLLYSAAALIAFFALPFLMLLRVSLARRDPSVYQGTGLTLEGYARLADPLVTNALLNTLGLALVVASISILVAVPATYLISRMGRRPQVAWLLGLLTTLALSEVLVTFSWQVLLSRRAGLSNILVWLGLLEEPLSLSPSYGALVACLVYVVLPFNVLALYPGLSRLDRSYMEAARTLGARPLRALLGIVLPILRGPIAAAYLMTVVISLGAYVAPRILAEPRDWTIGVIITDTAMQAQNLPMAAAIAVLVLLVALALVATIGRLGRPREAA
jgi:putative spermidine/putrescine transport system permease protein